MNEDDIDNSISISISISNSIHNTYEHDVIDARVLSGAQQLRRITLDLRAHANVLCRRLCVCVCVHAMNDDMRLKNRCNMNNTKYWWTRIKQQEQQKKNDAVRTGNIVVLPTMTQSPETFEPCTPILKKNMNKNHIRNEC